MEDKKNIYCKFAYKCGICGKEFPSVQERMNCEMTCVKRQKEEEKAAAEAKKKEEQNTRKAEVDAAFEHLHKLISAYTNDYGHYEYGDDENDANLYWPSRLWHNFWQGEMIWK